MKSVKLKKVIIKVVILQSFLTKFLYMKKNNAYLLLLLLPFFVLSQELPPIENYTSKEYGAENQNWRIFQSDERNIYVANNSGLLEFNGAKWKLYPSPNNTILRSVNVVGSKVYTGCYMEFGYWERNEFGSLKYESLSKKIKESLIEEDFWNILNLDNWILFQSLNRIYIYNTLDETFKIINSKTQLPKIFKVGESVYFQKMEEGIFKIEKGNPILVSDDEVLKTNILVNIFLVNDKILYQTQNKGFYYLKDEEIFKWDIKANNIISKVSVYSSLQLTDGSIILGTISNGIYRIDENGNVKSQINQKKGLNNNTVLSMYEDRDQNLWLGLDNGISVVNYNSPFSIYNDIDGKLGSVYTSAIFNGNLYLGTNQGLFYKKIGSNDDFKFVNETDGQVWFLKVIYNTLFCGHNKGTFIVNNNEVELICDIMGTMEVHTIPNHENLLIQGYYSGLSVLEKVNNKWRFRNKIDGFTPTSRFFEFTNNGNILVNHEYNGVFKLALNDGFTKVLNYTILKSAPKGLKSAIATYNNELLYASDKGVFKYDNQLEIFNKDTVLTNNFLTDDVYISGKLIVDQISNKLWGFTDKSLVCFSAGKLSEELKVDKIFLSASQRGDLAGFESVVNLNDGMILFGSSKGYVILNQKKIVDNNFEVHINSIEKSTLSSNKMFVPLGVKSVFNFEENNLNFSYSVAQFNKFEQINYKYQLKGFYNKWSDWTTESEVSFKNLPYGSYTFKVKAQKGNGLSENEANYSFVIDRPWYLSNELILVYSILFIGLLLLVHFLYKQYYSKQKKKLLEIKQHEFSVSQLENEKEIMELKNEKLQNEIESKTRELSTSTMNIIKKNELLVNIKNELLSVKDNKGIKPVLKIINNNLTKSSDWQLFEEAFNNADSDFLKKVKTEHPNLTPNDLRLCAYLRLNLSSKEIAPLLNISARSVEIKRYRLRKKMNLIREKSLVEYILEI